MEADELLLKTNAEKYGEALLRSYQRFAEVELKRKGIEMNDIADFMPLVRGSIGLDFSVSLLCYPGGTWVAVTDTPVGRYLKLGEAQGFTRDWGDRTYEEQKELVLSTFAFPAGARILQILHYASPGWLCREETEETLTRNGEVHGRDRAYQDIETGIRLYRESQARAAWQTEVDQIRRATDSPGTPESGRLFERGLRNILQIAGCQPREVRNLGEQIDATAWVENTPVIFELLNSKGKADAAEVRDLLGKLMDRPASVVGVLCAPSGFTIGAAAIAARNAGTRSILLWGREDIEHFLASPANVKSYFHEKYREFIDKGGRLQRPRRRRVSRRS